MLLLLRVAAEAGDGDPQNLVGRLIWSRAHDERSAGPASTTQVYRVYMATEGFTRLTHEIDPGEGGVTKLTLIHELEHAPRLAAIVAGELEAGGPGGSWSWCSAASRRCSRRAASSTTEPHRRRPCTTGASVGRLRADE